MSADLDQLKIANAEAWVITVGDDMRNAIHFTTDKEEAESEYREAIGPNGEWEGIYRLRALRFYEVEAA